MTKHQALYFMLVAGLEPLGVSTKDIAIYLGIAQSKYGSHLEGAPFEELGKFVDGWVEDIKVRSAGIC